MHMRHADGRPFKVGDEIKTLTGILEDERFYDVYAVAAFSGGHKEIGFLTSAPTSTNNFRLRKFNGDVVWWCDPPDTPAALHRAMDDIMSLISGTAMQLTIEVVVNDPVTRRKQHKYFAHVVRDLDGLEEHMLSRLAETVEWMDKK